MRSPAKTEFWPLEQVGASGGATTRLQPTGPGVSLRPFGRAAYDPVADRVLYFGGRAGGTTISNGLVILDLTQGADGAVTVMPRPSVPGRQELGLVFDEGANHLVRCGCSGDGTRLDDACGPSFATSPLGVAAPLTHTGPTPGPRTFSSWASDASGRRALLSGGLAGAGGPGALAHDRWVADCSSPGLLGWTQRAPANAAAGDPIPRGRVGAAAAFLPVGDRLLVCGGISDLATALARLRIVDEPPSHPGHLRIGDWYRQAPSVRNAW